MLNLVSYSLHCVIKNYKECYCKLGQGRKHFLAVGQNDLPWVRGGWDLVARAACPYIGMGRVPAPDAPDHQMPPKPCAREQDPMGLQDGSGSKIKCYQPLD